MRLAEDETSEEAASRRTDKVDPDRIAAVYERSDGRCDALAEKARMQLPQQGQHSDRRIERTATHITNRNKDREGDASNRNAVIAVALLHLRGRHVQEGVAKGKGAFGGVVVVAAAVVVW